MSKNTNPNDLELTPDTASRGTVTESDLFAFPSADENMSKRESLAWIHKYGPRLERSIKHSINKAKRYSALLDEYRKIEDEILG